MPLHELFGQSLSLDDLILRSQMDVVSEQVSEAKTKQEKISRVENFLIGLLNPKAQDELDHLAVTFIKQAGGTLKIITKLIQVQNILN